MRVLFVASEIFPLIKTGGLADVVGALPPALARLGIDTRCLVPGYPAVLDGASGARPAGRPFDLFGGEARLITARSGDLELVILRADALFDRAGNPYLGADRQDWPDNHRRFAGLARAAVRIADGALEGWRPDVVHGHDWHAGLVPAYLALRGDERPATVMTVHNLAYQGLFSRNRLDELGLPESSFQVEGVEFWGQIGFLKAGLFYADRLTTVSPAYARDIQQAEGGMGLDGLLHSRSTDLTGILNGIDHAIWDPMRDPHLVAPYGPDDLDGKAVNKAALQHRLGLAQQPEAPVFGLVSRLTPEKGLDLLLETLPDIVQAGGQLAMLCAGSAALEQDYLAAAAARPEQIGVQIGYDEELSHMIQGGADLIAVPSRIEPCGLTQMYGMRYGTLPLVGKVGGLADSVIDASTAAVEDGVATGFVFTPVTTPALREALGRAFDLYLDRAAWRRLQVRAMTRDFGWSRPAGRYRALYRDLLD